MSPANRKPKPRRATTLPYWLREFALIRLQAIAFVLTVALAIGAVSASRWYWHQARDFQAWAQQKRNAARDRLFNAETEKREIRLYQPQYAALRERGLIGQENRLDWVDAIRQIQEQRKLMPVSYELEPQQPVRMDAGMELGGYRLHGSRMHLHMDLLHEGDLFVLLDDLRQRSFYSAQECSIKRAASGLPTPLAPTLSADCTLNWLTLTPAPAPRIAQQWRPQ
ncbi:hypothetical protein ASD15_27705 [Massilia sp. Root351]|jgi:hypothetical protein|uniref:hypothetical protein n=1 Tax=Massilia sp. Root351 TaxID=1736522 RepID=UPI00070BFDDA|nr:hypothetical protein [Massilia sp. Root351]KQV87840.1 hypothetical protein ASD15_27705 [Massilia sp. Root351]